MWISDANAEGRRCTFAFGKRPMAGYFLNFHFLCGGVNYEVSEASALCEGRVCLSEMSPTFCPREVVGRMAGAVS
jgi:hypothetical protein